MGSGAQHELALGGWAVTRWAVRIGPHRAGRESKGSQGEHLVSKENDQDNARRVRAREVGLFRYGLIQDALEPSLSTKQRGRLVRALAAQSHPGPFGTPARETRIQRSRVARETRTGVPQGPGCDWAARALTSRPRCLVLNDGSRASWIRP